MLRSSFPLPPTTFRPAHPSHPERSRVSRFLLALAPALAVVQQPTPVPTAQQPGAAPAVPSPTSPFDTTALSALRWRGSVPTAVDAPSPSPGPLRGRSGTWTGTFSSGVCKTADGGITWLPIFLQVCGE